MRKGFSYYHRNTAKVLKEKHGIDCLGHNTLIVFYDWPRFEVVLQGVPDEDGDFDVRRIIFSPIGERRSPRRIARDKEKELAEQITDCIDETISFWISEEHGQPEDGELLSWKFCEEWMAREIGFPKVKR